MSSGGYVPLSKLMGKAARTRMAPEEADEARSRMAGAFVAGSLEELAAMCIHDGSEVPRWLQEGMSRDIDGTWPEWWREHQSKIDGQEPYTPNQILVNAAKNWAERNGVSLS